MKTWIFQGNPRKFRVNDYLVDFFEKAQQIKWSIRQVHYMSEVFPEDEVYIWRASGGNLIRPGIVAHGVITTRPGTPECGNKDYWIEEDLELFRYVSIKLDEVRLTRRRFERNIRDAGVLREGPISRHPVLSKMHIMRMHEQTNYLLSDEEATALRELWNQTRPG